MAATLFSASQERASELTDKVIAATAVTAILFAAPKKRVDCISLAQLSAQPH